MASDKTERITLPTWCCTVRPQAEFLRKLRRPLLLTNKQFRNLLLNGTIVGYKSMICTRGRTHTVLIHLGIIVNGDYGKPCTAVAQITKFEKANNAAHTAAVAASTARTPPPLHPSTHEYKVWTGPHAGAVIDFDSPEIKDVYIRARRRSRPSNRSTVSCST